MIKTRLKDQRGDKKILPSNNSTALHGDSIVSIAEGLDMVGAQGRQHLY